MTRCMQGRSRTSSWWTRVRPGVIANRFVATSYGGIDSGRSSMRVISASYLLIPWLLTSACGGGGSSPSAKPDDVEQPCPLAFATGPDLPYGFVGEPYEAELVVECGSEQIEAWQLTAGLLPEGGSQPFSLRGTGATTAVISGTPVEVETALFTVRAFDTEGESVGLDATIVILGPVEVTTAELPEGRIDDPYEARLEADGGLEPYAFEATGLPDGLELEAATGRLFGTPTEFGSFDVALKATDALGRTAQRTLTFSIANVDLQIVTVELPVGEQQRPYEVFLEARGGTGQGYTWRWLGGITGGITLESMPDGRGRLRGVPPETRGPEATLSKFEVADDSGDNRAEVEFRLIIAEGAPRLALATGSLPDGEQLFPYSAIIRASGGSEAREATYRWSITGLPEGLSVEPGPDAQSVQLSGTPQQRGSFELSIVLTDEYDEPGFVTEISRTLDLLIVPPVMRIRSVTPPVGRVDELYRLQLTVDNATGNGPSDFVWRVEPGGQLPPVLSIPDTFTSSTIEVRGVPTYPGTYTATITVADTTIGERAEARFVFDVTGPARPLRVSGKTRFEPYELSEFVHQVGTAGGARTGFEWSLVGGELPKGVDFTETGRLEGVPRELGSFSVTVRVEDILGLSDEAQLAIDVRSPLAIDTSALPPPVPGEPYVATLSASGGSETDYTWRVRRGSLPTGLSLTSLSDGTAELRGTTTDPAVATPVIEVEDSEGNVFSRYFPLQPRYPQDWVVLFGTLDDDGEKDIGIAPTDGTTKNTTILDPDATGLLGYDRRFDRAATTVQFSYDGSWLMFLWAWDRTSFTEVELYFADLTEPSPTAVAAPQTRFPLTSGFDFLVYGQTSNRFYFQRRGGRRSGYYIDLEDTGPATPERVTGATDFVTWWNGSAGDEWVTYRTGTTLKVVDVSGATPTAPETACTGTLPFSTIQPEVEVWQARIERNNDLIVLRKETSPGVWELHRVDLTTGAPYDCTEIINAPLDPMDSVRGFNFTDDGRRVAYVTEQGKVYVTDLTNPAAKAHLVGTEQNGNVRWRLRHRGRIENGDHLLLTGDFDPTTSYPEVFITDITGSTPGPLVKVSGTPTVKGCSDYFIASAEWGPGFDWVIFEANFDDCTQVDLYAVDVRQAYPREPVRITTDTTRAVTFSASAATERLLLASTRQLHYFDLGVSGAVLEPVPNTRVFFPAAFDIYLSREGDRAYFLNSGDVDFADVGTTPATSGTLNNRTSDSVLELRLQP